MRFFVKAINRTVYYQQLDTEGVKVTHNTVTIGLSIFSFKGTPGIFGNRIYVTDQPDSMLGDHMNLSTKERATQLVEDIKVGFAQLLGGEVIDTGDPYIFEIKPL
jgi:hypothetical protein